MIQRNESHWLRSAGLERGCGMGRSWCQGRFWSISRPHPTPPFLVHHTPSSQNPITRPPWITKTIHSGVQIKYIERNCAIKFTPYEPKLCIDGRKMNALFVVILGYIHIVVYKPTDFNSDFPAFRSSTSLQDSVR